MYKMSALSSRRLWRLCRSLLHIGLLVLSLPDLVPAQFAPGAASLNRFGAELNRVKPLSQSSFSSVDSFGSPITVFNMTTISPPFEYDETATKVTAETIDAILGALDNAAQTIENAQISTSDISWTPTTQRIPVTPEEGFTIVPPHAVGPEDYEEEDKVDLGGLGGMDTDFNMDGSHHGGDGSGGAHIPTIPPWVFGGGEDEGGGEYKTTFEQEKSALGQKNTAAECAGSVILPNKNDKNFGINCVNLF